MSTTTPARTPPEAGTDRGDRRLDVGGLLRRLLTAREMGVVLALVLLLAVTLSANPRFLSGQSLRDLLLGASILVVLAAGQAMVVITRNVDLSVGSVLGLSAYATGTLLVAAPGTPLPLVVLFGMLFGAACGLVNGAVVAVAGVPSLVVTLGTLYVFRGLDSIWASASGRLQINAADLPGGFTALGTQALLGVPLLAVGALIVVLAVGDHLRSYRSGRELYAIGSDGTAAGLSGIPVGRRVLTAFVVNGMLAGLAGVMYAARFGTLDATAGTGMELQVVAAVVIGGIAITGGSGTVWGAAVGAVLLTVIGAALPQLGVSAFWQQASIGVLILLAIGLDRALALRTARRLRRWDTRAT
ncbi:rhamnose transport system permease protein [Actinoalloteichus hoggarensis]|uniref:Autoinducer 2 import system permease protein LsrC n=2 Tax=Actinoalloteichus hoggarensis TaxID=1470176 RepID=A0A221WA81_9PSEU|nr:Autoinducer 2 import system permease protein LsrC [Actinoalloteichus hoggarensis]MBB5923043.1 rhamnose transport system permease protein [Actinoalloteichus hoggarensis]